MTTITDGCGGGRTEPDGRERDAHGLGALGVGLDHRSYIRQRSQHRIHVADGDAGIDEHLSDRPDLVFDKHARLLTWERQAARALLTPTCEILDRPPFPSSPTYLTTSHTNFKNHLPNTP